MALSPPGVFPGLFPEMVQTRPKAVSYFLGVCSFRLCIVVIWFLQPIDY